MRRGDRRLFACQSGQRRARWRGRTTSRGQTCQFHDAPEEGDGWKAYLPQVRAVLDAVHEPSDYMKEAGAGITRYISPDSDERAHAQDAANVWRFMIDAMKKQLP